MNRFSELTTYKNTIILELLTNENLVKALVNNQSDFLNYGLPEDVTTLLYTQIWPYRQVQSKITDAKSYITMAFINFRPDNGSFQIKTGKVYFYIIVHNSLVKTDEGFRYDYILSQIDQTLNGIKGVGIGKLQLYEAGDMPINDDYVGSYVSYDITDFQ